MIAVGIIDRIKSLTGGSPVKSALNKALEEQQKEFSSIQPSTDKDLSGYIDPVDSLPGEDHALDRDHFPDSTTDQDIDQLLEEMNADEDGKKTGRYACLMPPLDPDNDPDNFNDDDPDYPDGWRTITT